MNHHDSHPIAILFAFAAAAFASLAAAMMPALNEVSQGAQEMLEAINHINVMDDGRLRLVCIAGSIGGALLSVAICQPIPGPRVLIAKLLGSSLAGIMFTPMLARWIGMTRDTDSVLFYAGLVGLLSYAVLQDLAPRAVGLIKRWLGVKMDLSGYDMSQGRPHSTDKIPPYRRDEEGR